jgi:hypothetical protein
MIARRTIVGFAVLVGASLSFALAGSGAPAPSASPDARVSAPGGSPAPVPTALHTPLVEPSAGTSPVPASPSAAAAGAAAIRTLLPFALGTPAPAQVYAAFMRGAEHHAGVIDLVRKDDELYLDLRPDNFDTPYIILPSIASGVGGDAFAGRVYDPLIVIFKRVGKRVMWITPNTRYVADKGTAAAASLAISVADSVIQSTPIVAEDADNEHVVINPSIFLSDFEGIGADLGRSAPTPSLPGLLILVSRPSFSVDATKSYYLSTKAFPENDEIAVNLAFNGPANALPTVPDGRGIPIVVHYSIVAPPAHDPTYVPRYADDRVGYFITERKHFGNDLSSPPTQRFIDRWNLDAGPIVFTLTDEIPVQYRATVRRAILAWNDAFAKIGYPHAIEVHDPPADTHFDPDDARYNSVRWITSDSPDFTAISPHVSDPDTGQIIRATVVIDGESMRSVRRGFVDRIEPMQRARGDAFALPGSVDATSVNGANGTLPDEDYAESESTQAALGMSMLAAKPNVTPDEREAYAQAFLFSVVIHEVGHTLGLRHNFQGSTAFTYAELHDPAFVREHGTTGSVMDYTPANLAPPGQRQAAYFPTRLGPYDEWAIRYGYLKLPASTPDAEQPQLRAIASESTEPGLGYDTDEDASGPLALDPRVQRFDLSSDPLTFAQSQLGINDDLARNLTHTYPGDVRTYQDIRQTLVTLLNSDLAAANVATRYVGGVYTSRSHRGQRGGTLPFTPVPRSEQRRAFELIDRYVLSSHALQFSPELLNSVPPARFGADFGGRGVQRTDFPIREFAAQLQDATIAAMFNPTVIARIADESLRAAPGQTMDLADLFGWTNAALFDDLGQPRIAPLHRDVQRRFLDLELEIALLPSNAMDQLALPRDLQSIARFELRRLNVRLASAEAAATDTATRAHIDDMHVRVTAALHASVTQSL